MARDGDGEGILFTVFVDTSLDTHLATTVSDSETVSDLKRKITLEHGQAVPATGDVKVHSLKVKCGEIYYHLPESMPVKRAFRACTEEDWFLSADVSHVIHGSPSKHSMIVSNVKQKVPKFPGDDSRRKASKNDEGERPSHHKETKLKKRRRHESNVADGEHEKRRKKDKIPQAADLAVAVQKNCNQLVREADTGFQIPSSSIIMKEKQLKKKSKEQIDSKNGTSVANEKVLLSSKKVPEVSTDGVGVKDQNAPDISKTKTVETTTKIDTLKTTKPGSSSDTVGRSLNNQMNKEQQPPSGESDISLDSKNYELRAVKRKRVDEKSNMNSQSRSFKKNLAIATQQMKDTESEPFDIVPESPPVAKR